MEAVGHKFSVRVQQLGEWIRAPKRSPANSFSSWRKMGLNFVKISAESPSAKTGNNEEQKLSFLHEEKELSRDKNTGR